MNNEEVCTYIIDKLIRAGIVQKESLATECIKAGIFNRTDISARTVTQTVVDYLNKQNTISNTNLTNWCRAHKIYINSFLTLEKCLRLGSFARKLRRGKRIYYCKDQHSLPITEDMICLKETN